MPRRSNARARVSDPGPGGPASDASRRAKRRGKDRERGRSRTFALALGAFALVLIGIGAAALVIHRRAAGSPKHLRAEAEQSARAGDWPRALAAWRRLNATPAPSAASYLGEARAQLALGRAARAEPRLRQAIAADPGTVEAWRLLVELLWVEGRRFEIEQLAEKARSDLVLDVHGNASARVNAEGRRAVLRELTRALLLELPEARARSALARWSKADPDDVDARVAELRLLEERPRRDGPDRAARLDELSGIVAQRPEHVEARAALVEACADAGDPERGRAALDGWPGPEPERDARYWRLRGRWDLEYDERPDRAADALKRAIDASPQDWRSRYRRARALRAVGRDAEARQEARAVRQVREALDPMSLGPGLEAAFAHPDEPASLRGLAELTKRAGPVALAEAWRAEAARAGASAPNARTNE